MVGELKPPVRLTPREEEELLEAMEEIRRGEYVDGEELLKEIRSRTNLDLERS